MTRDEAVDTVRLRFGATYWITETKHWKLVLCSTMSWTRTMGQGLTWEQAIAAAEATRLLDAFQAGMEDA